MNEQAKKLIAEIERKEEAIKRTNSYTLERDYRKSIYRDRRELRKYLKAMEEYERGKEAESGVR